MQHDPSNRRRYPRIEVGVTGLVHVVKTASKEPVPCQIIDISIGGAFIHCTAPISIGEEIYIEIHFETNETLAAKVVRDPKLSAGLAKPEKSIVRWVRGSSKSGFGVEFVELSSEKKSYLDKLVQHFKAKKTAEAPSEA